MSSMKLDDEDKEFGYKLEQILNEVKYDGPVDQQEGGPGNGFDDNDKRSLVNGVQPDYDTAREAGKFQKNYSEEEQAKLRNLGGKNQLTAVSPSIIKIDGDDENNNYISRRNRKYDDDQSQCESDEDKEEEPEEVVKQSGLGVDVVQKGNSRFHNYKSIFDNLLKTTNVTTMYPICSIMITYDSTRAVTVTKQNETTYFVKMYCLETYVMTFEEVITGNYIKLKETEQNSAGKYYAVAYFDDGIFFLRHFGKENRSETEIADSIIRINDLLNIDNWTMVYPGFPDPSVTCTFVGDTKIFINLFHNPTLTHYHFIYDFKEKAIFGEITSIVMNSNKKNFPYKCFYNDDKNEVYSFYRQGEALTLKADGSKEYRLEQMTDMDLGQMFLVYGAALVARSSSDILFFKQEVNEITELLEWKQYLVIPARGFIYYIKGNVRIQITTDEKIYFYLIDKDTLMPTLENVMFNYMGCNHLMFGSKVRYGISYKSNERSFQIYRRKYYHNFKVPIFDANMERALGIELETLGRFMCTRVDEVLIYNSETYQLVDKLPIKLFPTETREPNEIIAIQKCQNEEYLAVISGKNLIAGEQKTNQLFIFTKQLRPSEDDPEGAPVLKFEQQNRIVLKDIAMFTKVSMDFHFKLAPGKTRTQILFAKIDQIFSLNFIDGSISTVFRFATQLTRQPQFFNTNDTQDILVVASPDDGIYVNLNQNLEVDIDDEYNIGCIKEIIFDQEDRVFYILCNKYQEKLGFFVLRMREDDPNRSKFLIKIKNKLDIGDCNISVLRKRGADGVKELIIGYKTIFINTYSVMCMDISADSEQNLIFRHEGFQLWESECFGMLLSKNHEFVLINRAGMQILGLGSDQTKEKRVIKDHSGTDRICHTLEGYNYLKVEKNNYLLFLCQKYEERNISVQQEYYKSSAGGAGKDFAEETEFQKVYNIKIWEITLRELMLFNSLYVCKTQQAIVDLVNDQPNPLVFYKSFLEFDGSNMVSILSFDSRSMEYLLQEKFSHYFSKEYPIFYRNKIQKGNIKDGKYYYRNAIDNALKSNQIKAVGCIIAYVVQFQNDFASSYMFIKNFPTLIEQGVQVSELLNSQVFQIEFDYDEWPGTHTNDQEYLRPYNESIFSIRKHYRTVFPEAEFDDLFNEDGSAKENVDSSKIYKIKYTINILPQIGAHIALVEGSDGTFTKELFNEDIPWMEIITQTEELDIFKSKALIPLILFKWNAYGKRHHLYGLFFHMAQIAILTIYVANIYCDNSLFDDNVKNLIKALDLDPVDITERQKNWWAFSLLIGVSYKIAYEFLQMLRVGFVEYFLDAGNYFDILYIILSISQSMLHFFKDPFNIVSKVVMIIVICLNTVQTLTFMRIFEAFGPIVVMLRNVVIDLQQFMLFYTILIFLFSIIISIIGIGNGNESINPEFYHAFQTQMASHDDKTVTKVAYNGVEYYHIGLNLGNFIDTFRLSLGDYGAIATAFYLTPEENVIFWFTWALIVIIGSIIFLNFVIAEASHSYEVVSEKLEEFVQLEKANMIAEAEGMRPRHMKTMHDFPKYIIMRQIDE